MRLDRIFGEDRRWTREAGADPRLISGLRAASPVLLPEELYTLLAASNGGEGALGVEPGRFRLWSAGDILALNRDYEVAEFYPGYFGFGSNGGGELLAFEVRDGVCGRIVMVAFIGGEPIVIADSFGALAESIGKQVDDDVPCDGPSAAATVLPHGFGTGPGRTP